MELKKDFRRVVVLELTADDETGYDEIEPFVSAFKKIYEDSKKVGFQNRFSPNEQTVLRGVWDTLKNNALTPIEETNKETSSGTRYPRV